MVVCLLLSISATSSVSVCGCWDVDSSQCKRLLSALNTSRSSFLHRHSPYWHRRVAVEYKSPRASCQKVRVVGLITRYFRSTTASVDHHENHAPRNEYFPCLQQQSRHVNYAAAPFFSLMDGEATVSMPRAAHTFAGPSTLRAPSACRPTISTSSSCCVIWLPPQNPQELRAFHFSTLPACQSGYPCQATHLVYRVVTMSSFPLPQLGLRRDILASSIDNPSTLAFVGEIYS